MVGKYVDSLPFYRQIEMMKRLGMDIPPATVTDWFKDVADLLRPLCYRIRDLVMDTDLRHTACVHSLKKMTDNGIDAYCCLPYLSTFMGHKKVMDTEYYLRLTEEVYSDIVKRESGVTSCILSVTQLALNNNENGQI